MTQRVAPRTVQGLAAVGTGVAGIGAFVLINGGAIMISVGGSTPEPAFDAPAAEIVRFFESRDATAYDVGTYLTLLGLVAFVWFLGGMWAALRQAEGDPAWRSMAAFGSGLLFAGGATINAWGAMVFRGADGLDQGLAQFAFDLDNLSFATLWVALGSFLLASGWVVLESRAFPFWLGWVAIIAGVGLVVARAAWTVPGLWFAPYALFWVWVAGVSIVLLSRARRQGGER